MIIMILSFTQSCNSGRPESCRLVDPFGVANAGVGQDISASTTTILFDIDERTYEYAKNIIKEEITNNQEKFRNWLLSKYQKHNAQNSLNYATKYFSYAFDSALINGIERQRKKLEIMQAQSMGIDLGAILGKCEYDLLNGQFEQNTNYARQLRLTIEQKLNRAMSNGALSNSNGN